MKDSPMIHEGSPDGPDMLRPLVEEFVKAHPSLTFRPDYEDAFASWIQGLDTDSEVVFIFQQDGIPVGLVVGAIRTNGPLLFPESYGYIPILVVLPAYRHRGVGKRLWAAVQEWFKSKGIGEVHLFTALDNPAARRFWDSCGFDPLFEMRAVRLEE
jgi:ribosomal protein S18 acetylase RimI-like enzyme